MKYLIILIALMAFACTDHCDDVVADYLTVKEHHTKKQCEADELYRQLEAVPIDSVLDRSLLEDELIFVMIDIAMIEIEMEAWKKQHVDCLNSY